jgi:peroxiredoxin (alkyl hydroperoxide reductase subunit C)
MKTKIFLSTVFFLITSVLLAQNSIPLIGSKAPVFVSETTNGTLKFPDDFGRKWKILFSHPGDFTPVCTSEILHLAIMQEKFAQLNVEIAVLSTDSKNLHLLWKKSMEEVLSKGASEVKINFPLIADERADISKLYGMLHQPVSTTRSVRGVFIVNPDNIVEATYFYPMNIGRNMEEVLRTVQALQTSQANNLFTPANWTPGGDLLVPHFPYTREELAEEPEKFNEFYNIGTLLWYKKNK